MEALSSSMDIPVAGRTRSTGSPDAARLLLLAGSVGMAVDPRFAVVGSIDAPANVTLLGAGTSLLVFAGFMMGRGRGRSGGAPPPVCVGSVGGISLLPAGCG